MTQHRIILSESTWAMPASEKIHEIQNLCRQEISRYRTCDYIPRLQHQIRMRQQREQRRLAARNSANLTNNDDQIGGEGVFNLQWREKICKWKYQGTFPCCLLLVVAIFFPLAHGVNSARSAHRLMADDRGSVFDDDYDYYEWIQRSYLILFPHETETLKYTVVLPAENVAHHHAVVDHFHLKREIVNVAMNFLDRSLATSLTIDKSSFQLLAMTCLYLSIKLNHHAHLLIPGSNSTLQSLLELSRGFFSTLDFEKKELELLNRLSWHVHPPTPQYFLESFFSIFKEQQHDTHNRQTRSPQGWHSEDPAEKHDEILELAHFFVELATMDYFFVTSLPSRVALAALVNANSRISTEPFGMAAFEDTLELRTCRDRMSKLYDRILVEQTGRRMQAGAITPNSSYSPVSDSSIPVRIDN